MKRAWKVVPAISLAMAFGCDSSTEPISSTSGSQSVVASTSNELGEAVTLVSLKVPNMV